MKVHVVFKEDFDFYVSVADVVRYKTVAEKYCKQMNDLDDGFHYYYETYYLDERKSK